MNDKLNKTTICAIAAIEIVDFSKKNDAEQINSKYSLNQLVNAALKEYARYDRILLDKGDGVVMAYLATPEDMLAIMVDIRQQIMQHNAQGLVPIFVRIGIHLGAVRVVHDVNEQPNFIGEGLNEAQRITHFAQENGIVVSPAYYAVTLPLPSEIAALYAYSGFKKDPKATEYQAYALDSANHIESLLANEVQPEPTTEAAPVEQPGLLPAYQPDKSTSIFSKLNWKVMLAGLAILLGLYVVITVLNAPKTPEIIMSSPEPIEQEVVKPEATKPATANDDAALAAQSATATSTQDTHGLLPNETIEELPKMETKTSQATVNKDQPVAPEAAKITVTDEGSKSESKRVNKRVYKKSASESAVNAGQETSQVTQTATTENEPEQKTTEPAKTEPQTANHQKAVEKKSADKSGWDSFKDSVKQGSQQRTCSQGEVALGQCK